MLSPLLFCTSRTLVTESVSPAEIISIINQTLKTDQ